MKRPCDVEAEAAKAAAKNDVKSRSGALSTGTAKKKSAEKSRAGKKGSPGSGSRPESPRQKGDKGDGQVYITEVPEKGPVIPVDLLKGALSEFHEKFISDFEAREKLMVGKIRELGIRLLDKPPLRKQPPRRK
jgi:hypothetical protein